MIPAEAVEAALGKLPLESQPYVGYVEMRAALEAAAPYLLAPVTRLADAWHKQGEEYMADSKTFAMDERIAVEFLKEGAAMVENARHIRNAIAGTR